MLGTVQQFVPVADVPTVNLKYEAGRHCLDELKVGSLLFYNTFSN